MYFHEILQVYCLLPVYIHIIMYTSSGRLVLTFNKIELIFQGVVIIFPFRVSASQIAVTSSLMSGPQFTQLQSTVLSGLGAMLESYHKLQQKPKTVSELKYAHSVNLVCLTGETH